MPRLKSNNTLAVGHVRGTITVSNSTSEIEIFCRFEPTSAAELKRAYGDVNSIFRNIFLEHFERITQQP